MTVTQVNKRGASDRSKSRTTTRARTRTRTRSRTGTRTGTKSKSKTKTKASSLRGSRSGGHPGGSRSLSSSMNSLSNSLGSLSGVSFSSAGGSRRGKGKTAGKIAELRLRLAGAQKTIRAIQEELHERGEEIEELRTQLEAKTRALEASRSLHSAATVGGGRHRVGADSIVRRSMENKMENLAREAEDAVADARRREQRSVEINASLRKELARSRRECELANAKIEESAATIAEMKVALQAEQEYTRGVMRAEVHSTGTESLGPSLRGPGVTMRMLRQEIERLRLLVSRLQRGDAPAPTSHVGPGPGRPQANSQTRSGPAAPASASSPSSSPMRPVFAPGRGKSRSGKDASKEKENARARNRNHAESVRAAMSQARSHARPAVKGKARGVGAMGKAPGTTRPSAIDQRSIDIERYHHLKKMYDKVCATTKKS